MRAGRLQAGVQEIDEPNKKPPPAAIIPTFFWVVVTFVTFVACMLVSRTEQRRAKRVGHKVNISHTRWYEMYESLRFDIYSMNA